MLYDALKPTTLLDLKRSAPFVDVALILVFTVTMILGMVLGTP
jgi:hypothetical protein